MYFNEKNKNLIVVLLVIIGVLFLILNIYTPIMHDDVAYLYKFGTKNIDRPTSHRIKEFSDILESQYYHYLNVNGRFFSHFLIQFMLWLGKPIFNVLNAVVLPFSIYLVSILTFKNSAHFNFVRESFVYLFIFFCYWFCLPFLGQTMLWLTGAVNFFWSSFFFLIFYGILTSKKTDNINVFGCILLMLFSFFAGGSNESITLGASVSLVVYAWFNRKTISKKKLLIIFSFLLGTFTILIAPGTSNRVSNEIVVDQLSFKEILVKKFYDFIAILYYLKYLIIIFAALLLVHFYQKKQSLTNYFKENYFFLIPIIINVTLFLYIGKIEERVFFGTGIFLILIISKHLSNHIEKISTKILFLLGILTLLVFAVNYYQAFTDCTNYKEEIVKLENRIVNEKQNTTYFPQIDKSRFVNNTLVDFYDIFDYHNRIRSFYFNTENISILPQNIYQDIIEGNKIKPETRINRFQEDAFFSAKNKLLVVKTSNTNRDDFRNSKIIINNSKLTNPKTIFIDHNYYLFIFEVNSIKNINSLKLKSKDDKILHIYQKL